MERWERSKSSRRHWVHTEVEDRVIASPVAERVRARMLRAVFVECENQERSMEGLAMLDAKVIR